MHTSNSSLFCGVYFVWTSATFSIFFLFIFESFIRRKPMKSKRNFKYFHFHFLQLGLIWIGWYSWNERPSTDLSMFSTSNLKEYSHKNSFKWNRMNYLFVNILLTLFSVAPANVIKLCICIFLKLNSLCNVCDGKQRILQVKRNRTVPISATVHFSLVSFFISLSLGFNRKKTKIQMRRLRVLCVTFRMNKSKTHIFNELTNYTLQKCLK